MGYVFDDNSKLDSKEEVLRQAEDKLVAARDLLKECREYITMRAADGDALKMYERITDFIGD